MSKKNLPSIHSSKNLTISFPDKNIHLEENESKKTRIIIQDNSVYSADGHGYINKNDASHLLGTDKKGVNRIYNNLDEEDKLENGNEKFISIPAMNKEVSKRLEEPRDTLQRERLRDTEGCINAMRDAPELEKIREVKESKNRKEQPKLKAKKIKAENITSCQLTGDALESDADAHHIVRKSDEPNKASDLDNIIVINKKPHKTIHIKGAESEKELEELSKDQGWKTINHD